VDTPDPSNSVMMNEVSMSQSCACSNSDGWLVRMAQGQSSSCDIGSVSPSHDPAGKLLLATAITHARFSLESAWRYHQAARPSSSTSCALSVLAKTARLSSESR
jgi:hypothetical protein